MIISGYLDKITDFFIKTLEFLFLESSNGLNQDYIGIIGTLIAILFTILITIVANSSNKYPTRFIKKLRLDSKTRNFYIFLVLLIIVQTIIFYLKFNKLGIDILFLSTLFYVLFRYWQYILNMIDPITNVEKIDVVRIKEEEISNLGDYARIGIQDKNDVLAEKSINKLVQLNEYLKK